MTVTISRKKIMANQKAGIPVKSGIFSSMCERYVYVVIYVYA